MRSCDNRIWETDIRMSRVKVDSLSGCARRFDCTKVHHAIAIKAAEWINSLRLLMPEGDPTVFIVMSSKSSYEAWKLIAHSFPFNHLPMNSRCNADELLKWILNTKTTPTWPWWAVEIRRVIISLGFCFFSFIVLFCFGKKVDFARSLFKVPSKVSFWPWPIIRDSHEWMTSADLIAFVFLRKNILKRRKPSTKAAMRPEQRIR